MHENMLNKNFCNFNIESRRAFTFTQTIWWKTERFVQEHLKQMCLKLNSFVSKLPRSNP